MLIEVCSSAGIAGITDMNSSNTLSGVVVRNLGKIHDYTQIEFCNGAILSIFNRYVHDFEPLNVLQGKRVEYVREYDDRIVIAFEGAGCLIVGTKDSDFSGPEAMVLTREGEPPVVWS